MILNHKELYCKTELHNYYDVSFLYLKIILYHSQLNKNRPNLISVGSLSTDGIVRVPDFVVLKQVVLFYIVLTQQLHSLPGYAAYQRHIRVAALHNKQSVEAVLLRQEVIRVHELLE